MGQTGNGHKLWPDFVGERNRNNVCEILGEETIQGRSWSKLPI